MRAAHRARDDGFLDMKHTPNKLVSSLAVLKPQAFMSNPKLSKYVLAGLNEFFIGRAFPWPAFRDWGLG
jgi:hypothetical protein